MLVKGSASAKAFMAKLRAAKGKKKPAAKKINGAHDATIEALQSKLKFYEWNKKEFEKYLKTAIRNKKTAEAKKLTAEIEKFKKIIESKKADIETLKKPLTEKKPAAKKRPLKTGFSNKEYDLRHQAKAPGKRISKKGNKYTENRENRSDKSKLLGIAGINKDALALIADRKNLLNDIQFRQIPLMQKEAKLLKGEEKKRKLASIKYAREFMSTLKKEISMYKKHI